MLRSNPCALRSRAEVIDFARRGHPFVDRDHERIRLLTECHSISPRVRREVAEVVSFNHGSEVISKRSAAQGRGFG